MGLEYIVQPQVFLGGLTALGPGILTNYEVDGYTINGDLTVLQDANITGNITAADSIVTNVIATTLSTENINSTNLSVINLTVVNSIAFFTVSGIAAASFTLTNNDSNKIIHCDTTTTPYITAIFPNSLNNGFNVNLFNTGTGTIVVSSTQSPAAFAAGTENNTQYSGMTIYKHNSQLFGMGVFD